MLCRSFTSVAHLCAVSVNMKLIAVAFTVDLVIAARLISHSCSLFVSLYVPVYLHFTQVLFLIRDYLRSRGLNLAEEALRRQARLFLVSLPGHVTLLSLTLDIGDPCVVCTS
jgi:hypothetical protein